MHLQKQFIVLVFRNIMKPPSCSYCGCDDVIDVNALFCPDCGEKFGSTVAKYCESENCNHLCDFTSRHCSLCGHEFERDSDGFYTLRTRVTDIEFFEIIKSENRPTGWESIFEVYGWTDDDELMEMDGGIDILLALQDYRLALDKSEKKGSGSIKRDQAKSLGLKLYRIHAESVQLPFILVWAKGESEALDWAKQRPIEEWYEHKTKPHFVQEHKAELIENESYKDQEIPVAGEYEADEDEK